MFLFAIILALGAPMSVNATLWDRGGGLIYDDVLNITWLQDANYAMTTGYAVGGKMYWQNAMDWAENLNYYDSVRNVTWTDWRLPQALPLNGTNYQWVVPMTADGSTDGSWNISAPSTKYSGSTASELAYLYYNSLSNLGGKDIYGNLTGYLSIQNVGPFINVVNEYENQVIYWSGSIATSSPSLTTALRFSFLQGYAVGTQGTSGITYLKHYAWAVRDGDVGEANQPPVADAGPDQAVILGSIVTFDGSGSSDPDGTIMSYDWSFGDGNVGSGETTTHVYALSGEYEVSLTVEDDDGAIDTDISIVTVQTPQDAVRGLISSVKDLNLPKGTENSLLSKLENTIKSLDKGQDKVAVNKLNAFINKVKAQRGKKITDEDADNLTAAAQWIIDNI